MNERRSRRPLRRTSKPVLIAAVLTLILSACGARLSSAQRTALDSTGSSGTGTGPGSVTAPNAAQSPSGSFTTTLTTLAGGGGNGRGGTGNGGSNGGGSKTGTVANTGGQRNGTGPVILVNDPLAGPGGKVCPAGAAGSGPGVTSSTITLGNIATINGPVPGLFAGARYGAEAVAAYINSLGGLCGRQLVIKSADDQFDVATDRNEAQAMSSQVMAFMGSFTLQDSGIPEGAPGVPDVGGSISAERFDAATNFSPQPNAPGYTTGPYQFFRSDPKFAAATQHMALLVENTPQTATTGAWMASALKAAGYHFVFTDTNLQPTDPTFNGDVQKMKASGVTGVVFQATGTIIGQLANAMYQAGMTVVLGDYCPAAYDPAYISNAGPGVAGTVLEQSLALYDGQDAASIPMVATLDQWYARVNPGQVPDLYATYAWMSGLLLAEGMNAGGAATRTALMSGLKQITSFNADGLAATSNPAGKVPPSCWLLIDVQNNQFVRDPSTPSGFKCSPSGYYHAS